MALNILSTTTGKMLSYLTYYSPQYKKIAKRQEFDGVVINITDTAV